MRPYRVISAQLGAPHSVQAIHSHPIETQEFVHMEGPEVDPAIHMSLGLASGYRMPSQYEIDEGIRVLMLERQRGGATPSSPTSASSTYLEYLDRQRLEAAKARAVLTLQRAMAEKRYQASKDDKTLQLERKRLWHKLLSDKVFLKRYSKRTRKEESQIRRDESTRDDSVASDIVESMLADSSLFNPLSGRSLRHLAQLAEEISRVQETQQELDKLLSSTPYLIKEDQENIEENQSLSRNIRHLPAAKTISGRLSAFGEPIVQSTDSALSTGEPDASKVRGYRLLPSSSAPMLSQYLDFDSPELRRPTHVAAASYRAATGAAIPVSWRFYLRDLTGGNSDVIVRRGGRFVKDLFADDWPAYETDEREDEYARRLATRSKSSSRSRSRSRTNSPSRSKSRSRDKHASRSESQRILQKKSMQRLAARRVCTGQQSAHKSFEEYKKRVEAAKRKSQYASTLYRPKSGSSITQPNANLGPQCGQSLPESHTARANTLKSYGSSYDSSSYPEEDFQELSPETPMHKKEYASRDPHIPSRNASSSRVDSPLSVKSNNYGDSSSSASSKLAPASFGISSRLEERLRDRNSVRPAKSTNLKRNATVATRVKILPFVPSSLVRAKLESRSRGEAGRSSKHLDASDKLFARTLTAESADQKAYSESCSKPPFKRTCAAAGGVPDPYGMPPTDLPLVTSDSCFKLKFGKGDTEWKSSTIHFPGYLRHRGTVYHDIAEELIPSDFGFKNPLGLGERCVDPLRRNESQKNHDNSANANHHSPNRTNSRGPSPTTERGREEAEDAIFRRNQFTLDTLDDRLKRRDFDLGPDDEPLEQDIIDYASEDAAAMRKIVYGSANEKREVEKRRLALSKSRRLLSRNVSSRATKQVHPNQTVAFVHPI